MTPIDFGPEILIGTGILLIALRWAHRCWGKAILSTLFAPLIGIPMMVVTYIAFSLVMRILNWFPDQLGYGLPVSALSTVASFLTAVLLLWFGILYLRDQRHLSTLERGARFGGASSSSAPEVFRRRFPG